MEQDNRGKNAVSVRLLGEVYENVTMGCENLTNVLPEIQDKFLIRSVTAQLESYAAFAHRAETELKKYAALPKKPSFVKKAIAKGSVLAGTLFDSGDAHVADMIERGTRAGAAELEKNVCDSSCASCDGAVLALCRDVIAFEREAADKVKDFL